MSIRESNSGLPYSKPTHYQLSYAAPLSSYAAALVWATPPPKLSYAASLTVPRRTLTKLHRILSELRRTQHSYAASLLCYAEPLMSYTSSSLIYAAPLLSTRAVAELRLYPYWFTPHPHGALLPLLSYVATVKCYATLHEVLCTLCRKSNFPQIQGNKSYLTLQLLHSEFPYLWGKLYFLFYQCSTVYVKVQKRLGTRGEPVSWKEPRR